MKATLNEDAIKIAYAAAFDETRPILEHVVIGNGEIAAADGFLLARRPIPTESQEGEVILIKAKAILEAHRILKGDELIIETQGDNKTASIKSNNDKANCIIVDVSAPLLQDGKFPAYQHVIPRVKRKAYVALQASLIAKMLRVTGSDSGRAIKIKVRKPEEPVEIHSNQTDVYMMPYFVPEAEGKD